MGWEVEGKISIIWYLCTKMGELEMGCGHRVTFTIEFGLLSFLTLQEIIKILKCFFVAINGIRIVGIPTKCKKDDAVMHYTRVNVKSLVRSAKYCIILLPFQLTTQRGNQHCCTYWLTKKRLKQRNPQILRISTCSSNQWL